MVIEYIRTSRIQPGDILAKDLYDEKMRVLLRADRALTETGIRAIREQGYKGIYIKRNTEERREDIPIAEPLLSEFETFSMVGMMAEMVKCSNVVKDPFDPFFTTFRKKIEEHVDRIIDIFYEKEEAGELLFETEDARTYRNWLYYHSVNTCLLSVGICVKLGFTKEKTREVAMGAMFHDIGKMFIPRGLVNKVGPSKEEKKEIRKHTELGYQLFKKLNAYSLETNYAIWQHHEREDGSGYPNGIKGDKIRLSAKIVSLASSYDNMVNFNPFYDNPMPQSEALEQICGDSRFSKDCVSALMQFVVPYPAGTRVKLSDGREALVLKNHAGSPLRPCLLAGRELLNLKDDLSLLHLVIV